MLTDDIKVVSALGRSASLGDFYDLRNDGFVAGLGLFSRLKTIEKICDSKDSFETHSKFSLIESDKEKFELLNIEAELQLSLLFGMVKLEGHGKYFANEKSSHRCVNISLSITMTTKTEKIRLNESDIKPLISYDSLNTICEHNLATHIVTGIQYGGHAIITLEYDNTNSDEKKQIEGILKGELNKLSVAINGKVTGEFKEAENNTNVQYKITICGDVLPDANMLQNVGNVDNLIEFVKTLPGLIKKANDGKGKPITYYLTPIEVVLSLIKSELKCNSLVKCLNEDNRIRIIEIFDRINDTMSMLLDMENDMKKYKNFITADQQILITKGIKDIRKAKNNFKSQLKEKLQQYRNGEETLESLLEIIKEFDDENDIAQAEKCLASLTKLKLKLEFYENAKQLNASLIYDLQQLCKIKSEKANTHIYILFYESETQNSEAYNTVEIFLTYLKEEKDKTKEFLIADLDVNPKISQVEAVGDGTKLCHLFNQVYINKDLLEREIALRKMNLIESKATETILQTESVPFDAIPLSIPCPNSFKTDLQRDIKCDACNREWICNKCLEIIIYGFGNYFYCSCGKTQIQNSVFKCNDSVHGTTFSIFDNELLRMCLLKLQKREILNILILGESGVGKSTWINGLYNYLTFNTMEEAVEFEKPFYLVPASFSILDDNFKERKVYLDMNDNKNERAEAGKSATKDPRSYLFKMKDYSIRLIDTPGLGDTDGKEQDDKNMQMTINYISQYNHIHGICILLKPNDSRLSIVFSYCIKELLAHLHSDASKNIVFCFTNTRGTFYKPGNTFATLQALLQDYPDKNIILNEDTMYSFDNEAFRFLCAKWNGIKLKEQELYESSWKQATKESWRLINKISNLPKHLTNQTVAINDARNYIMALTKPIADIQNNIQTNITVIEDKMKEIERLSGDEKDLKSRLYVTEYKLESVPINYPKTVCTDPNCTETTTCGNQKFRKYTKVCHDHCQLSNVTADVINDSRLLQCWAMNGTNNCRVCGCSYSIHMHIRYDQEVKPVEKIDQTTQSLLMTKKNTREAIQTRIAVLRSEKDEFEKESRLITEVSVKFAWFLKKNAIAPYNDALKAYLEHLLEKEKEAAAKTNDNTKVHQIRQILNAYLEQVEQFQKLTKSTPVEIPKPENIKIMLEKLFTLPRKGKELESLVKLATSPNTGIRPAETIIIYEFEKLNSPLQNAWAHKSSNESKTQNDSKAKNFLKKIPVVKNFIL